MVAVEDKKKEHNLQPKVADVIQEFQEVFEEPVGLPLTRVCDHKIILKEGINPVLVRPYRYPRDQKSEIEKIV